MTPGSSWLIFFLEFFTYRMQLAVCMLFDLNGVLHERGPMIKKVPV